MQRKNGARRESKVHVLRALRLAVRSLRFTLVALRRARGSLARSRKNEA